MSAWTKQWYYFDSWAWSQGTWGAGGVEPTRVYHNVQDLDSFGVTDATATNITQHPQNTNRRFVWRGNQWVLDDYWAGNAPKGLTGGSAQLPAPTVAPPQSSTTQPAKTAAAAPQPTQAQQGGTVSPWWILVPLAVVGVIFYEVVGPRRWT